MVAKANGAARASMRCGAADTFPWSPESRFVGKFDATEAVGHVSWQRLGGDWKSSRWPPSEARRLGSGGYHGEASQRSTAVNWTVGGGLLTQDARLRRGHAQL